MARAHERLGVLVIGGDEGVDALAYRAHLNVFVIER